MSPTPDASAHPESVAGALDALDRYMAALNARDEPALNATLHFPHVRFASARVATWETPGSYSLVDFLGRAGDGWQRSRWETRRVIHAGPDKVHFDVEFSRWRADGSPLGRFRSIYIVTRVDGRWAIQARSSFAA